MAKVPNAEQYRYKLPRCCDGRAHDGAEAMDREEYEHLPGGSGGVEQQYPSPRRGGISLAVRVVPKQ